MKPIPEQLLKQYDHAIDKAHSVGAMKMLKNAEAAIGRWYLEQLAEIRILAIEHDRQLKQIEALEPFCRSRAETSR